MNGDLVLGLIIGFLGTWGICAIGVLAWVIASTIATARQQRRRGW